MTGQTGITAGAHPTATFSADDSTTDHNSNEHSAAPMFIALTCGAIVAGVGFTIYGTSVMGEMTGSWKVRWTW